jgi:uncharacterized protein (DUF3820 family)
MSKRNQEIEKNEQRQAWDEGVEAVKMGVKTPLDKVTINPQMLVDLVSVRMPFGKYKDYILCDLPEPYLVWFHWKGFPPGKIGALLAALYEIKLNGLGYLLKPIRKYSQ